MSLSEEYSNIIVLIDEDDNEIEFEFLDEIEHKGETYVALFPLDDEGDDVEYVILQKRKISDEETELIGIDNAELLDEVFTLFKRRWITQTLGEEHVLHLNGND